MQKLIIGIKLDDKVVYLKTIDNQENSNVVDRLIKVISIFVEHNFGQGESK